MTLAQLRLIKGIFVHIHSKSQYCPGKKGVLLTADEETRRCEVLLQGEEGVQAWWDAKEVLP